jgi:toxin ParE1/3/4
MIQRIAKRPRASRPREELLPGLRSVLATPYTVFFRLGRDGVEIVRVLHERRDIPTALAKDNDLG